MSTDLDDVPRSAEITPDQAHTIQDIWIGGGTLLIWTVYDFPADHRGRYVARAPLEVHMTAASLRAIREKLPPGLACFRPADIDDPMIVETWL